MTGREDREALDGVVVGGTELHGLGIGALEWTDIPLGTVIAPRASSSMELPFGGACHKNTAWVLG